jgi:3',5'-cyclic AMP phosphodiesterase CpdA
MYIYEDTGYTPTSFAFSKITYTKPNDSRIDILEKNQLAETSPISINAYTEKTGLIGGSDNKTYYNLGKHIMIPVNEGDMLRIYANSSNMAFYAFMTGNTISANNVPLVSGTVRKSVAAGSNKDILIPETCTYLYVNKVDGNGFIATPSAIYHLTSFQDVGDMIGAMEDVHYNNRQEEFMVKSLSRKLGGENEPKHIVIAQITDTHGTTSTVVKRFVEWVNKYMNEEVDVLVHTGDVQHLQWSDTEYVDYNSITGNSPMPVLIAPGNHDQCSFGNGNNELTAIYNRWILPLVNKGVLTVGETRAAGQVVEGDTYYYKDFTSKKIRMIMLNDFDPLYNGFYAQSAHSSLAYTKHRWSQNQINMLLQALTTVPSGYTVVVGRHARPSTTITDENWSVDTFPFYQTIDGNKVVVNNDQLTNGLPINDILNAYATKSVMPATEYTWTDSLVTTAIGSLNVPETSFANSEGDLAFVMNGHDHVDFVGYYTSAPNVRVVTCGCGGHFTETYYMDVAREYNIGKGQDVINAYVIDTTNKKVWVVRIGANFTLNGKWRKVTSFNY